MNQAPVFLSAGIPDKDFDLFPANRVAIREAVRSLVGVVLPTRPLVFGGHPAISPLVWEGAESLGLADRVFIYQSRLFEPIMPEEANYFKELAWSPTVPDPDQQTERDLSLGLMRSMMIERRVFEPKAFDPTAPPDFPEYVAAVFLGGMKGILDEWDLFRKHYPQTPAFAVGSTAGAAGLLHAQAANAGLQSRSVLDLLRSDLRYRHVFRTLLP